MTTWQDKPAREHNDTGIEASSGTFRAHPADRRRARRPYRPPQIVEMGDVDDFLEVLGPAQAGYGGMGMPSDRTLKADVTAVDLQDVLTKVASLPVSKWRYATEAEGIRHVGPMAQDFHALFGLGDSDRVIHYVDAVGVNLASIQALSALLGTADTKIAALEEAVERLAERLGQAEARIAAQDGVIGGLAARIAFLESRP